MRVENLYLIGGITASNPEYVGVVKSFLEIEKSCADRNDDVRIDLYINSTGGWSTDGLGLYSIIMQSKIPVRTINIGSVESTALVIFLAGSIREAYPFTRFHYHPTSQDMSGNTLNLQRHLDSHKKIQAIVSNIVVSRTKITTDILNNYNNENKEVYWDTSEAIELGIIGKVIEKKCLKYGLKELPESQKNSLSLNLEEEIENKSCFYETTGGC